ncbi:Uncharacterized conserved protein, DUF924 family [Malonomonas rubra DSM 5091]|uniref:Uncharacterized conserved protein, DUF924 family n=1 Tax=Malonomonas rubra DSM 5091 TaxID=1122189 RepID=A0A1M6LFJ0_MALRU|nr:DUF924 family protein [Malonomonas rubra]SHJ69805.1 Uncharacterized conserved protein, DUF924 family [Malonomonas rubra DSM 5091]
MEVAEEILHFWFGNSKDDLHVVQQQGKLWFGKDAKIDRDIEKRFSHVLAQAAASGVLAGKSAEERCFLATILLFDQFPRNIFRNQAQAFAYDHLALKLAEELLERGLVEKLRPVEKVFVYLPLEHSEDNKRQQRSVELFAALLDEVPDRWRSVFAGFYDYALRHQEIITRFGRYPHRNAILGRESTQEELEFLQQPNSSF